MRDQINRLRKTLIQRASAGWAFADQGVISLCNFVTVLLLARILSASDFGLFVLVYSVLLFATALQHATLTQAHNVLAPRLEGDEFRIFTAVVFKLQIAAAIILATSAFGISMLVETAGFDAISSAILGLAIAIVPWLIQDAIRRVLYTRGRARAALLNDTVSYGLQCGGVIYAVTSTGQIPVLGVFAILGVSSGIASIMGIFQLRHCVFFVSPRSESFIRAARQIWQFSRWLSWSEMLRWFGRHGHIWLLGIIVGIAPVGAFRAVLHLANVLNPIKLATMAYLPSKASSVLERKGPDAMQGWLIRTSVLLLLPYTLIALVLSVFSIPLIHLAFGGKYDGSGLHWILVLGAVVHVLSFIRALIRTDMIVLAKTPAVFRESLISVVLLSTVGVVCIYFGGLIGAQVSEITIMLALIAFNLSVLKGSLPFGIWLQMIRLHMSSSHMENSLRRSATLKGNEADVYPLAGGLVRKQYGLPSRMDSLDAARNEFESLTRLSEGTTSNACVEFPEPCHIDEDNPAVVMTRKPGIPLSELLAEIPFPAAYLDKLGKRLAESIRLVTSLLRGPYMDFSAHNILLDSVSDRMTFLDFGEAQWKDIANIDNRPVETAVGHFIGNLLTQLSNPRRAGNSLARRQYLAVASALLSEIISSSPQGPELAMQISRVIHDKYRFNADQGGRARRSWFASIGEIGYRINRRGLVSRNPVPHGNRKIDIPTESAYTG